MLSGPVPRSLSRLTRLVELNLSYNRLSGRLSKELCGMGSLATLQLSHNQMDGKLPVEVGLLMGYVRLLRRDVLHGRNVF